MTSPAKSAHLHHQVRDHSPPRASQEPNTQEPNTQEPTQEPSPPTQPTALGRLSGGHDGSRVEPTALGTRDGSWVVDRTVARATALGCLGELGQEFGCVLPGHEDRAVLYPTTAGHWRYRCAQWTAGLAEVRASIAHRRPVRVDDPAEASRLGSTVVARWAELLDYEAGLLVPRPVEHELPSAPSDAGLAVAHGVLLLLALRDERWDGQGFTFTRRFAAAWCGISEDTARRGLHELRAAGFLILDGKQGLAHRWRLGTDLEDAW